MPENGPQFERVALLRSNNVNALTSHITEKRIGKEIITPDDYFALRTKIQREFYDELALLTIDDLINLAKGPEFAGLCIGLTAVGQFEVLRFTSPEALTINQRLEKALHMPRSARDVLYSFTTPIQFQGEIITQKDVKPQPPLPFPELQTTKLQPESA